MAKLASIGYRVGWLDRPRVKPITTDTERMRGRRLQLRNARLLSAEPLCRECCKHGRVTPATQMDHIVPLHQGGPDDETNLQPLCNDCHDIKSAAEAKGRGGSKV